MEKIIEYLEDGSIAVLNEDGTVSVGFVFNAGFCETRKFNNIDEYEEELSLWILQQKYNTIYI